MNLYDVRSVLGIKTAEYADLSPLFINRLHSLSNDWVLFKEGDSYSGNLEGPRTIRSSRIIVIAPDEPLKMFRALVHEVGHAKYLPDWHKDPSIASAKNKSFDEFQSALVNARIKDEGEAVLNQFEIAHDIYRNTLNRESGLVNIGTGLPKEKEQKCLQSYIRYIQTLRFCNTEHERNNLRDQARLAIGKIYVDLIPDPQNDPRSYLKIFLDQAHENYNHQISCLDDDALFLKEQSEFLVAPEKFMEQLEVYRKSQVNSHNKKTLKN